MDQNNCSGHLAIQDTFDALGGKWKLIILASLTEGKKRFKELSRKTGISPRMLSKELRDLERNQLVRRVVCDTKPMTVEYSLTLHSQSVLDLVDALKKWGKIHRAFITGRAVAD